MIEKIIILLYMMMSVALSSTPLSSFDTTRNVTLTFSITNPNCNQPVAIRDDYTYTAGIGAHKVHDLIVTWNVARRTCDQEGGHFAIINSIAEANVIKNLLQQTVPSWDAVWIGFHDLFEEDEYVTVHSQSLSKAGFSRWASTEPSKQTGENCGGFHRTGFLHDIGCDQSRPFVCELPAQ